MALSLALTLLGNLVVVLFILICAALILIVLLQKGRGGGLGSAFGGGGAGSLLGTKTGDFLTWVTITLVAGFLVLAVLMGKFMRPSISAEMPLVPASAAGSAEVNGEDTADTDAVEESTEMTDEAATVVDDVIEEVQDEAATVDEALEVQPEEGDTPAEPVTETTE